MAKISKSRSVQEDRYDQIKNELLAISKKNSKQLINFDKSVRTNDTYRLQNLNTKKKILQCKIIRNPAIPFVFTKKSTTHKKLQSLIANT
jgi:hypothetical protein